MKGAMASPSSLLYRRMGKHLYPTTCYHFNSGGEPEDIPALTHDQLRTFHAKYYHPSNAWFYSYGNFDLAEHLAAVEQQVLNGFDRQNVESSVPSETRNKNLWSSENLFRLKLELRSKKSIIKPPGSQRISRRVLIASP